MNIPIEIARAGLTEEYVTLKQRLTAAYWDLDIAKDEFSAALGRVGMAVTPGKARYTNGRIDYRGCDEWKIAMEAEAQAKQLSHAAAQVVDARQAVVDVEADISKLKEGVGL